MLPRSTALLASAAALLLSANFMSGQLPDWLTFTKTSHATYVDNTGKITFAPNNMLINSNGFSSSGWGAVSNGTLTSGIANPFSGLNDGWALVENTTNAGHNFTSNGGNSFSLNAGDTVIASVYLWQGGNQYAAFQIAATGLTTAQWYAVDFTNKTITLGTTLIAQSTAVLQDLGGGLFRAFILMTAPAALSGVTLAVYGNSGLSYVNRNYAGVTNNVAVNFAYLQMERVTYQTTPSIYKPSVATAYYGPRFDYDPVTLAARGLLIEATRTNQLLYSADYTQAAWTKTSCAVNDTITSPDGTANALGLKASDTTSVEHSLSQAVTVSATATPTPSVYVKAGRRSWVAISVATNTGALVRQYYNLSTGAIGSHEVAGTGSWTTPYIFNAGNGWWRIFLSLDTQTFTSLTWQVSPASGDLGRVYAAADATGTEIYVWGAQLETDNPATSYIPTGSATVARTLDGYLFNGQAANALLANNMSVIVQARSPVGVNGLHADKAIIGGTNANNAEFALSGGLTTTAIVRANLITLACIAGGASPKWDTTFRIAMGANVAGRSGVCSGGAVLSDTTLPWGQFTAFLSLGSTSNGTAQPFVGWIECLAIYNKRLSDGELQRKSIVGTGF